MNPKYEAAHREAPAISREIERAAGESRNEAELRSRLHRILAEFAERNNVPLSTREELTVATGRLDTIYNHLIVEYKSPGVLRTTRYHKPTDDAIIQLRGYLSSISDRGSNRRHRSAGVVIDGRHMAFVRTFPSGWVTDPVVRVNPQSTERLLKFLVSLGSGVAIHPDNLVNDFGPEKHERARRLITALYDASTRGDNPLAASLFSQWKLYFSEVAGYDVGSEQFIERPGVRALLALSGKAPDKSSPERVLFCLHTYFALLIKLISWLSLSPYVGGKGPHFGDLVQVPHPELKSRLEHLERGGVFRDLGIRNFLEADFFGWYIGTWDDNLAVALHEVIARLSEYDPGTIELDPEGTRDLLKKLYQFLIPREIRHDLGEYYTPDWLAQLALNRLESGEPSQPYPGEPTARILDPACGSGTFLVLAIDSIRKRCSAKGLSPSLTLQAILRNVVGIDLNPLAVIAARANYILAILDLLPERETTDLSIPVYLADSVAIPTKATTLDSFGSIRVLTAVGQFNIPAGIATSSRLDAITSILDESVESGSSVGSFLARVRDTLPKSVFEESEGGLSRLYTRIEELHNDGLNGIWARILKNASAPLFIGDDFDYIVGNPPWINWESLPEDYRSETKPLWFDYGLFPKSEGGMDTILGRGKKDLSMLMTYAAADRHLKPKGVLSFVVTQTLFKTSGASRGFRRFRIGRAGPHLGVRSVDDLSAIQPFEGATNRTSIMVLSKGIETKYPTAYVIWTKLSRTSVSPDSGLQEALSLLKFKLAAAIPSIPSTPTSSWLTGPPEVLDALQEVAGASDYRAREGVNTGGANAVFWVEKLRTLPGGLTLCRNVTEGARRKVRQHEGPIESEVLYPLARGRDVSRWKAAASIYLLFAQDTATRKGIDLESMQSRYPKAFSWLKLFESQLGQRKSQAVRHFGAGHAFYTMFGVGEYTLSDWKVVWPELSNEMSAAVIGPYEGRPVLPDHTLVSVSTSTPREAHYLCAMLNSAPSRLLVKSSIVMHADPHLLEKVRVPKFNDKLDIDLELARLCERAHQAVARGVESELGVIEMEIDRLAASKWGLRQAQLSVIRRELG